MVVLLFCCLIALLLIYDSLRAGISPTPTSGTVKKQLLAIIPSLSSGTVVELGSGWGTLAASLARRLKQCSIVGYEMAWIPYLFAQGRQLLLRQPNLSYRRSNFYRIPLQEASLVVCYLYPAAMKRLKEKLEKELRPGTWVVSHTFAIPSWTPIHTETVQDLYHTPLYLYRIS